MRLVLFVYQTAHCQSILKNFFGLQTNTFQIVLVTDEVRTYAMFNYAHLGWTTNVEAGGDSNSGQGGVPAFVSLKPAK